MGVPCEIQSATQVMDSVAYNESQITQSFFEVLEHVYKRLRARIWLNLNFRTVIGFLRDNSSLQIRDVLFGSINLQVGISKTRNHDNEG